MVPDQPPEAVHEVPAGAVQVRVAPPPFDTAVGVAFNETAEAEPSEPSLPPQALRIDKAKKTSGPRSPIIRPRQCSSNAPLLDKLINVPLTIYAEDNISSGGDMIGELASDANVSQFTYGTRVLFSLAYVRSRNVQEKKLRAKSGFSLSRDHERSALFFREDGCAREGEGYAGARTSRSVSCVKLKGARTRERSERLEMKWLPLRRKGSHLYLEQGRRCILKKGGYGRNAAIGLQRSGVSTESESANPL